MQRPRLDVLAIGDAVVDIIAEADDAFLMREQLVKGSMRLIDEAGARRLYAAMGPARAISGGSAANTVAGIAALGGRAGFVGQVADDQFGTVFTHDIRALGVEFTTPPITGGPATGQCLILVTPDAQRTMSTFPGASHRLSAAALDRGQIEDAAILYLEGYLIEPEGPRRAMREAIGIARAADRSVAFTLSDIACIARRPDVFAGLVDDALIDILFANEQEIMALAGGSTLEEAIGWAAPRVPLLVVTCSEKGAIAIAGDRRWTVGAAPVARVVDTTGAGDLFAAGFLFALAEKRPIEACLDEAAQAAARIIAHYGARPERTLPG